jgi:hypothetical protein
MGTKFSSKNKSQDNEDNANNTRIINVKEINCIPLSDTITCLLTLKDGRLASSSIKGNFIIYK